VRTVAEVKLQVTPDWSPGLHPSRHAPDYAHIILGKYSTLMDRCNKYEFKVPDIGHEAKLFYLQKNKSRRAFFWAC